MGLPEPALWALTPWEYDALRHVYEEDRQDRRDIAASIMALMHRAWWKDSKADASTFGGRPAPPPRLEDFTHQDVATKKAAFRSTLMAAWAAKKKKLEAANGR